MNIERRQQLQGVAGFGGALFAGEGLLLLLLPKCPLCVMAALSRDLRLKRGGVRQAVRPGSRRRVAKYIFPPSNRIELIGRAFASRHGSGRLFPFGGHNHRVGTAFMLGQGARRDEPRVRTQPF